MRAPEMYDVLIEQRVPQHIPSLGSHETVTTASDLVQGHIK
jgi:hypothetical protein